VTDLDLDAIRARADAAKTKGWAVHWVKSAEDVPALLARIAELEAERDDQRERGDQYNREAQHWAGKVVDLEAAERRGYERAVARLRDEDELRRWQATELDAYQRSFMPQVVGELMARYLDAVKEGTDD